LIVIAFILVVIIFFVSIFRGNDLLSTLQFVLVLVIASIPVALPAVLSVTLAVGATALAKKEAIVSKLVAIEELAGMDILCSDKTGTITKNQLSIAEVDPFGNFTENDILLFATMASREEDQDPIDDTIIAKARTIPSLPELIAKYTVLKFLPFDPVIKRTEATIKDAEGNQFKVTKGAPQIILSLIANKESIIEKMNEDVERYAVRGYRTLGVAKSDAQEQWKFIGIIPLYDPPQDDSAATLRTANAMGVEVKMVTGDHAAIAKQIAKEIGLGTNILPVSSFIDKHEKEAIQIVENANGFAQVFPEHKYKIVELLQAKDHIVGMTGDGVNDAPALKKADAGVAVAGATDAAKSAADIVFTKPGLSTIIDAIKESRKIFQRMNNYAIYRISETIRVLIFMTLAILVFNFYPVTAIMIVLLALLNDAPVMTIAYDNVLYSDRPERWNMRMILTLATLLGVIGVVSSFGIFYIGESVLNLGPGLIQSFMYLKLSIAGQLTVLVARTRGHFWSIRPHKLLIIAILTTQTIATLITVYGVLFTPLGWFYALFVIAYALIAFVITDFLKVRIYKLIDHSGLKFHK
jgi:H+-transporting ATPase